MKKSLIALAVLAASGAAMAQSSVTLYGRLDASVGQTTSEVSGYAKNKQTGVNSSDLNTTFWGLKGSEDLGGGLRANFGLESGFNMDNGSATGTLFERKAIVGLSGAFGAVDLGRNYTAYDTLRGATNNVYDSNFATTGTVWKTGIQDYANRTNNSISYTSPSFGGISGQVAYAFGENKNTRVDVPAVSAVAATIYGPAVTSKLATSYNIGDATDTLSLHVKYANGPLLVGYGYQEEKIASTAGNDKIKYNLVGASYDLGMAKLVGSYNQAKTTGLKDKEYQVGVSVPFGAAAIAAGYSNSKSEGAGANNKGTGASLVGTYNLSKRTTVYAGYEATKVESKNAAVTTKLTNFATGVRHTF
jgi:predicted porin